MGIELKLAHGITLFIGVATLSFSIVFWEIFVGGILINAIYKYAGWQTTKKTFKKIGYALIVIALTILLAFLGPKGYLAIAANWKCFLVGNGCLLMFWGGAEAAQLGIFRNKMVHRWHWISLGVGALLLCWATFIFYETFSCGILADQAGSDLKTAYHNAKHILLGAGIMSLFSGGLLIGLCFEKAKTVFSGILK